MSFKFQVSGFTLTRRPPRADRASNLKPETGNLTLALLLAVVCAVPVVARADEKADRQFTFAVRLTQRGEHELAQEAFEEFIAKNPGDERVDDARYYIGLLAYRRGDATVALKRLGAITKPKHIGMAATLLLRGQIKLASGDAPGAVADLEKVDASKLDNETKASWHYLLGGAYRAVKNPTAAAKQFDLASEADSNVRGLALLELGKVRIEMGESAAALEALTGAIDSQLDAAQAAEARALAGAMAYEQRQYEMSAHLYNQIVQRHQASVQFKPAMMGLLRALYASGQDEELVRQHDALSKLLPPDDQAEALYLRSAAHTRLKQYDAGAKTLLDFFQRYGTDHELSGEVAYLFAVCFYHTDLDRFEKWYSGLEGELDKMPRGADLRYLRAQAAIKRERLGEAITHLTPLVEQTDNNPYAQRALLQRAALHEKLDNKAKASADYALYVTRYGKDPKSVDAGRWAIDLAFNAGEYEKVTELAPGWAAAQKDQASTAGVRIKHVIALVQLKRYDAALRAAEALLGIEGVDAKLATLGQFYRGLILASQATPPRGGGEDTTKPAIESLRAALAGPLPETQQAEAIELVARLHRMAKRDDEAIAMYETLRQRRPLDGINTLTALWVGRGLHRRDKHDTALVWLSEVLGRRDTSPDATAEALFLTAEANRHLDKHAEALKLYDQLLAFGHAYRDQGRLGRAHCLAELDRTDEALKQYDELITVEASMVAATALLEGGLLQWRRARKLEKANDTNAADEAYDEARKRLNRVTILYDLPQLAPLPSRAMVMLGVVDAASGKVDKRQVREHLEAVTKRQNVTPWHTAAKAEIALLDGRRGEAVFHWRKMISEAGDADAEAYARSRLADLGETP